jgi:hypothetical protein
MHRLGGARGSLKRLVLRSGIAVLTAGFAAAVLSATSSADATDDYPIPHRIVVTACTAEQILAAARDFTPVYYERYIIDKHNKSPDVQQAAIDRAHWFFSLIPDDRRAYAENIATNVFYEKLAFAWPNWAKIFFNNKGVAAKETDNCANYPRGDQSVWEQ